MALDLGSIPFTRRRALVAGGLGTLGLTLPQLLRAEAGSRVSTAKSVILVVAWGGPSQHDTFDPKPDAPAEVRSVYGHIATRTPGLRVGEHLARMAERSNLFSVIRSLSHHVGVHHGATHYALTGHPPKNANNELTKASRDDFPTLGSVLAKVQPSDRSVPSFVQLPHTFVDQSIFSNGQNAGFLGIGFDPLVVTYDPKLDTFGVAGAGPAKDADSERVDSRRQLLGRLHAARASTSPAERDMEVCYAKAFDLLNSAANNRAFDLSRESPRLRDRYGRGVGQSMLVARRLVEAGVRLVLVNDANNNMKWDTHDPKYGGGIDRNLRESDQGLSALLDDLSDRGMLDNTLVVWMGEFGRTPKRKPDGGRDHWPKCYSALMAGGGIQGGRVHGSSDALGAYPRDGLVRPEDVHATIHHLLGIALDTELHDALGRPYRLCPGTPIRSLL